MPRRAHLTAGLPIVILLIVAILLVLPATRKVFAALFSFTVEHTETLDEVIVDVAALNDPAPSLGAGYEVTIIEIPEDRWEVFQRESFRTPQSGEIIQLSESRSLPVPASLPDGFEWQDVIVANRSLKSDGFASLSSQRSGGGGENSIPEYDASFAAYVIGGDSANRLLLLTQFDPGLAANLVVRTFYITTPATMPPSNIGAVGLPPIPTLVPQFYEDKTQIGYLIQAGSESQRGLVILAQNVQDTSIQGVLGSWYQGTWSPEGEWLADADILTLTWEHEGFVYQLTGQGQTLTQLVEMAATLNQMSSE